MNSKPYFKIDPDGAVKVLTGPPPKAAQIDYKKKPVQFAIRRDPLALEIHGENFSTTMDLNMDDALSIILMLTYAVREVAYTPARPEGSEVSQ